MNKINLLVLGVFLLSGASAYADATTGGTGAPSTGGATTTKAAEMDCGKLQDNVLAKLDELKTDPDAITSTKCKLSTTARAEMGEEISVGEKSVKGACLATYSTINHYADLTHKKLSEVCSVIESAKDISSSCDSSQKACLTSLAGKDKAAAAKLKELSGLLKKAKKDLAAAQKKLKDVAEKYKREFAKIDEAIEAGRKNGNLQSTLSSLKNDVFSEADSNALSALSSNGFQDNNFPTSYKELSSNIDSGFDNDGKPAPAGLGKYTEELATANTSAAQAIKTVDVAAPKISSVQESFESRASDLNGTGSGLGSISPSTMASLASATSGVHGALKNVSGASAMLANGSGLAGALKKPGSGDSSLESGQPGNNKIAMPGSFGAPPTGNAADSSFAPIASPAASPEKAASAEVAKNELLTSFTSLGPVSEGDELDLKAARAQNGKSALGAAASAGGTYISSTAKANGSAGASAEDSSGASLPLGAGVRNSSKTAESSTFVKSGSKEESLRDALRRRLAERTKAGDAAASSAVDDLLYSARSPASLQDSAASEAEQAGPLGMESDPLFTRVHHAHSRFLQRAFPRQAGL